MQVASVQVKSWVILSGVKNLFNLYRFSTIKVKK
ncbi:hypothetical protein MNBD_CHLOROFLEXI01-2340 [hydrothermal vent metagenome]|uniref:Uncharacterized protein n=1 Tax=hydrothermal vent metagenome TaxID=652676 RepID=A0A3B0VBZ9_9ZZZZ